MSMASIAPIALSAEQNTELMPSGGMQHGGAMRDALPPERWNIVHHLQVVEADVARGRRARQAGAADR